MAISNGVKEYLRDRDDSRRNVIFLDIDGVLQPCRSQKRYGYDLEQTKREAAEKTGDKGYLELDKYDIGSVYYDWDKTAVEHLHDFLWHNDAEIVISSDWKRFRTIDELRLLFRLHNLDEYITDIVPYRTGTSKPEEIGEYLRQHPKLVSYVVIDDLDMEKYFRGHTVCTAKERCLTAEYMQKASRILRFGPWWQERYIKKASPEYIDRDKLVEDYYKKVIFLDIDGVLNDDGPERDKHDVIINPKFVRNLSRIIDETGAEVVLSSSWRYIYGQYAYERFSGEDQGMEVLLENLDRYGIRIPGITPRFFDGPDGRPFEIRSWLCHRPEVENFVILDDETFWNWQWLQPHVVCTAREIKGHRQEYMKGLDERCARKAIKILQKNNTDKQDFFSNRFER